MDLQKGFLTALKDLQQVDPKEYEQLLAMVSQIAELENLEGAKTSFLSFVKLMWPGFIYGNHHKIMAQAVEDVVSGRRERLVVNQAPRTSKSEFFSYLMPAWALGLQPQMQIIQICGTGEMAIEWSRKVRNLVMTEEYQRVFPGVRLRADSKAAGRWHTSHGGVYHAVGAEGNITGRGADLCIIDDPTGEQQAVSAMTNPAVYDKVYNWYVGGPRQRLQPGGRIAVVQSRWATNDFTGRLLKAEKEADSVDADHWHVIELPAVIDSTDENGQPIKKSLWPEFWSLARLEATRLSLPPFRWNAQYMQQPGSDSSAILKREYWKRWPGNRAPKCDIKIVTMDTAFSDKAGADYTACMTWGVFEEETARSDQMQDKNAGKILPQLFLLDAWKDRVTFPDLKAMAHKHYLKWQPDIFIVEGHATGQPLIYELRARGIPVSEYRPAGTGLKGQFNSKIMRANGVSDIMASGMVWAPETRWAEDVIDEVASFPGADHDDYVDTLIMALMRFRQGGFIRLATDDWDERPRRMRRAYY